MQKSLAGDRIVPALFDARQAGRAKRRSAPYSRKWARSSWKNTARRRSRISCSRTRPTTSRRKMFARLILDQNKRLDGARHGDGAANFERSGAFCPARMVRPFSAAVRRRQWTLATLGTGEGRAGNLIPTRAATRKRNSSCTIIFRIFQSAKPGASAAPAGGRLGTARWRSVPSNRWFRWIHIPTPFA